ncbi:MAG: hypothetical protein AAF235_08525, partial [Planctomycetota bacterium]
LAETARGIEASLTRLGVDEQGRECVASHRRLLEDVERQLSGDGDDALPPPNSAVYAGAIDITEWQSILAAFAGASEVWRNAIANHARDLSGTAQRARSDRLALGLAALCRSAGLRLTPAANDAAEYSVDLAGWHAGFSFAPTPSEASAALAASHRVGMIVVEAGASIPAHASGLVRGADDRSVLTALGERLNAWLTEEQPRLAEQVDPDYAFAAVAHATLAGLNVASGRVLFAECWRTCNLCSASDPRIDKLRRFNTAIARA